MSSSPIHYLSFWIFAIALAVLLIAAYIGMKNGSWSTAVKWTMLIAGLVALFGLWLLLLNYTNCAIYIHNVEMHGLKNDM